MLVARPDLNGKYATFTRINDELISDNNFVKQLPVELFPKEVTIFAEIVNDEYLFIDNDSVFDTSDKEYHKNNIYFMCELALFSLQLPEELVSDSCEICKKLNIVTDKNIWRIT